MTSRFTTDSRADQTNERTNRGPDVVATAVQVMSERGYAATSMREIADRVGMLKGSLYYYFTSKEDLLLGILEDSHAQVEAIATEISSKGLSPLQELLEYLHDSSLWYLANVERANIFFTDRRHLTGDRYERANHLGRAFEKKLQKLVRDGQATGEVRADQDARLIARFVMGTLNNVRFWTNRNSEGPSADEMAVALITLVHDAISAR